MAGGVLAYREQHGHTVIERSYDRPVRFSPRVVVMPPDAACTPAAGDVVVRLAHGAAFGTGRHPTTRLSVRAIDAALTDMDLQRGMTDTAVLDVGTGSGILAVTAMLLGVCRGVGLDIDPCAVDEARRNAALNGLSARLSIGSAPIEDVQGPFSMITANLRLPTLRRIFPEMLRLSRPGAAWIVSGIRPEEIRPLKAQYAGAGRRCLWEAVEKDWAALVLAPIP